MKSPEETPEPSEWSENSGSIEIIMDQPNQITISRPMVNESNHRTILDDKLNNIYWWLPKLQQPTQQHMDEFNNFSTSYLCNSVWWKDINPIQYL